MENRFTENRIGTGTMEWADKTYNICSGCAHGCLYCFAKSNRCRFDEIVRRPGAWEKQVENPNKSRHGLELGSVGVVMFPSSHDITPEFLPQSLETIKNLLLKNKVLIVTKPHLSVVRGLCRELAGSKDNILFRFTIGSLKPEQCAFWEPNAPLPSERLKALRYAFEHQFQTSVSVEPMIDDRLGICELVEAVEPYVTDTIWVGKMNRIPRKHNAHVPGFAKEAATIKSRQTDDEILALVKSLKGRKKVRWKDSIKAVIEKHDKLNSEL